MMYGKGWIKDPAGHKVTGFHVLKARLGKDGDVPVGHADLYSSTPPVMDQGQSSSCTGHATACAISTSTTCHGRGLAFVPSPDGIYKVGRCVDRVPGPGGSIPLLDDGGAMPNQIWRGVTEWGIKEINAPTPDGRYSDVDPAHVNDSPTLDDFVADAALELMGQYQITSVGPQFVTDLCVALDMGYAVAVGVFVDTAFENWGNNYTSGQSPLGVPDTNDPNGGGHYICLIGYTTVNGKRIFKFRNSWGVGWGDNGEGYGDENFAAGISDAYVAAVLPRGA